MLWKKEYELGVELIDSQHLKLVEIINEYKNNISDNKINSKMDIGPVLVHLINYTSFHFNAEENFMVEIGYPSIEAHKIIHKKLISLLREILIKMKNKNSYTPIEFYYFLMTWLNDHILGTDLEIAKFYKLNKNKITLKKPSLSDIDYAIQIIKPNLERINREYFKKEIDDKDVLQRRAIFFNDFIANHTIESTDEIVQFIFLIQTLLTKNIIMDKEVKSFWEFTKLFNKSAISNVDLNANKNLLNLITWAKKFK